MGNRISIVIPTKNEERRIETLLKSIRDAKFRGEVIVVDANSKDKTRYIAKKYRATVIDEKPPHSLPSARNQGIDASVGDVVILLDADNEITKNFFARLREGKNWDALRLKEIKAQDTFIEKIYSLRSFRREYSAIPYIFRREILEKIKFDPSLGLREDVDFFSRVSKLKIRVRNSNAAIIVHSIHTFDEMVRQMKWYGRTSLAAFRKSGDFRIFGILAFIILPALFLQVPFWLKALSLPMWLYEVYLFARSKSVVGVLFPAFDFIRSLLFLIGILESAFAKRTSR